MVLTNSGEYVLILLTYMHSLRRILAGKLYAISEQKLS